MIKEKVQEAYNFAKKQHEGQMRKYSDLPYFVHPKNVARIVEELTQDEELIICALCHDLYEDTNTTMSELIHRFGNDIARVVWNVSLREDENKTDQIISVLMDGSYKEVIIKLADRYHNLLYLNKDIQSKEHLKFIKKYYYATKDIFTKEVLDRSVYEKYRDVISLLKDMVMNRLEYLRIQFNFD